MRDITNMELSPSVQTARALIQQLRANIRILREENDERRRLMLHLLSAVLDIETALITGDDVAAVVDNTLMSDIVRLFIPVAREVVGNEENIPPPPPLVRQYGSDLTQSQREYLFEFMRDDMSPE